MLIALTNKFNNALNANSLTTSLRLHRLAYSITQSLNEDNF